MSVQNGGKRQEKIKFLSFALVSDGAGGWLDSAATLVLETWSSVKQIKASRVAENYTEAILSVYEFKLLKRAGFEPQSNYTIEWRGDKYEITGINENVEDNREWALIGVYRGKGL